MNTKETKNKDGASFLEIHQGKCFGYRKTNLKPKKPPFFLKKTSVGVTCIGTKKIMGNFKIQIKNETFDAQKTKTDH